MVIDHKAAEASGRWEPFRKLHVKRSASVSHLMHNWDMRTTITIDDETHEFASYYARARGITLGAAIDELIRKAQGAPEPAPDIRRSPNGFPMFPPSDKGETITSEMVKQLEEEEFDPKKFA
jgi:hypothetical protein